MTGRQSQFNRLRRAALPALLATGVALRLEAECAGVRPGRIGAIAGAYAAGEGLAFATQHRDWWPEAGKPFHFIWGRSPSKGQDALLHASLAYQTSQLAALAWDWACLPRPFSGWLGALTGIAIGIPKEIGDGFHNGFSGTDLLWTGIGAVLPALHRSWPASTVASLKVFYWPSAEYPDYTSLPDDYAGQRFYLSINPSRVPGGAGLWPAWLGITIGHGVPHWITIPPEHDWYLTLDLDFRGLPIKAAWWRKVASVLDQGHVPLPGVRIRAGKVRWGMF